AAEASCAQAGFLSFETAPTVDLIARTMMKGTSITALPAYRDAHARPAQRRLKALSAWLHRGVVAILPCRAAVGMAVAIAFAPAFMDFASGSIDFAAEFIDIAAGSIDFAADSIDFAT